MQSGCYPRILCSFWCAHTARRCLKGGPRISGRYGNSGWSRLWCSSWDTHGFTNCGNHSRISCSWKLEAKANGHLQSSCRKSGNRFPKKGRTEHSDITCVIRVIQEIENVLFRAGANTVFEWAAAAQKDHAHSGGNRER